MKAFVLEFARNCVTFFKVEFLVPYLIDTHYSRSYCTAADSLSKENRCHIKIDMTISTSLKVLKFSFTPIPAPCAALELVLLQLRQ